LDHPCYAAREAPLDWLARRVLTEDYEVRPIRTDMYERHTSCGVNVDVLRTPSNARH
jgi:hypothetical protein